MEVFLRKFLFKPELSGLVGVERECFFTRDGDIVPIAGNIIPQIKTDDISNELSNCQLEYRVGPCTLGNLEASLKSSDENIDRLEKEFNFQRSFIEVAPEDMSLSIYPHSNGRYENLVKVLSKQSLSAACRVTGTHVHIGMPNMETALKCYSKAIKQTNTLSSMGDASSGERLRLYSLVCEDNLPPSYPSVKMFLDRAIKDGFEEDPKSCYHLIRISVHGTIEFRMFGSTSNIQQITSWAKICHGLCFN